MMLSVGSVSRQQDVLEMKAKEKVKHILVCLISGRSIMVKDDISTRSFTLSHVLAMN